MHEHTLLTLVFDGINRLTCHMKYRQTCIHFQYCTGNAGRWHRLLSQNSHMTPAETEPLYISINSQLLISQS